MALKLTNNARALLDGSIAAGDTILTVTAADAAKFPALDAGDWFPLTVEDAIGNIEIMRVTARAGASFSRDDWLALSPETFICSQIGGQYAAFYDTRDVAGNVVAGCLLIDMRGTPFITRSAARATAAFYDREMAALYYQPRGSPDILELDSPAGARKVFYWRSKPFVLAAPHNFGAIRVDSDAELTPADFKAHQDAADAVVALNRAAIEARTVRGALASLPFGAAAVNGSTLTPMPDSLIGRFSVGVYADGKRIATIDRSRTPERLPSGFLARTWEIDVSGDVQVEQIALASTMDELKAMSP